jgi:hypothetical protein
MKKENFVASDVTLDKAEIKYLKSLGFKKEWADDKSCFWMVQKLRNPLIRGGHISIEPGVIIVWGYEPKCISGYNDSIHMISGLPYERINVELLLNYFGITL